MRITDKMLQLGAYLLIVVVGMIGFHKIDTQSDQRVKDRNAQQRALCAAVADSREGLREAFSSTAGVGLDLLGPAPTDPPERVKAYNSAILKLNEYRDAELKKYPQITCTANGTAVVVK